MESPTTEISIGMEALQLGITDKCQSSSSTATNGCNNSSVRVIGQNANNFASFESLRESNNPSPPCSLPSTPFDPSLPPFTQLQTSPDGINVQTRVQNTPNTFCIEPTTDSCNCKSRLSSEQSGYCHVCTETISTTTLADSNTHTHGACSRPSQSTNQDIVNSFNSLCVNGGTSHLVPTSSTLSCRQQQAVYDNYGGSYSLDDTTVDDLAGYFDEIMYLPKPMSEMAELMYT